MLYFAEQSCDFVVLETGLGGRLDATNVIDTTILAVLTSISMDHAGILGDTLEEIACQKAGIMKKGCPVVSAMQRPEVMQTIIREAQENNCPLMIADPERLDNVMYGLKEQSFTYTAESGSVYRDCRIRQAGTYQVGNAMLALEVLDALKGLGCEISDEAVREGMLSTFWFGRFSVISTEPMTIIDGAHNRDGAENLAQSMDVYLKDYKKIFIMGVFADKEYEAIAACTAPVSDMIYTIQTPDNARALDAGKLLETAVKYQPRAKQAESIAEAVEEALVKAKEYEENGQKAAVIAFGSLSHLAELYREFGRKGILHGQRED